MKNSLYLAISSILLFSHLTAAQLGLRDIISKYDINGMNKLGGTDKDAEHSYVESYEYLLSSYIDKPINLLEIGVNRGGSALMWHEYLPEAQLVLVDIRDPIDSNIRAALSPERYVFIQMDAYDRYNVQKLSSAKFDVIIDDGLHSLESQIFLIENYIDLLSTDGLLIIEDVQSSRDIEVLKTVATNCGLSFQIFDLRKNKGRHDDILFVVRAPIQNLVSEST